MNFRQLNIVSIGLLLILVSASVFAFISAWWIVPFVLVYSIILGWGIFDIGSQFFMPVYWKGEKGKVAFTFDDGPHPEFTPQILAILKEEKVQATFFCIGKNVADNPELSQRIADEGHTVGNHSYSHAYVFTDAKAVEEHSKGREVIERIIGKRPAYFRPPFGVMNPKIVSVVNTFGDSVIGWDLRSRDGTAGSEKEILKRVRKKIDGSTLLLFHDTNPHTPKILKEVIHLCRKNGMEIVSVQELSGITPYHA